MEEKFKNWLLTEIRFKRCALAPLDILLLVCITQAGAGLRNTVWQAVLEHVPYQHNLEWLKIVTALFDEMAALCLFLLVFYLTGHKIKSFLAYSVGIMLPVMAAGSAMWGMGDSIYITCILLAVYFLFAAEDKEKSEGLRLTAFLLYGVAVFLNFYSLFLLPLFVLYCFVQKKQKVGLTSLLLCSGSFFLLHQLLERGNQSVFLLFLEEARLKEARGAVCLSYGFPNIYQIIGTDVYIHEYGTAARYLVVGAILIFMVLFIRQTENLCKAAFLRLGLILTIFIPFFMPFMDERASLLAAVLSVVYGFVCLEQFYIPIIQVTLTYLSYAAYFRGESFLPMPAVAFVQFGVLLYLIYKALKNR